MATAPLFAATPRVSAGTVSSANTNRDGTGILVTVFTAGTNGSRVDFLDLTASAVVAATMVRLFIHDGTTARLWMEVATTATTPSATQAVWSTLYSSAQNPERFPLVLPTGYSLRASINDVTAPGINIHARGGDF